MKAALMRHATLLSLPVMIALLFVSRAAVSAQTDTPTPRPTIALMTNTPKPTVTATPSPTAIMTGEATSTATPPSVEATAEATGEDADTIAIVTLPIPLEAREPAAGQDFQIAAINVRLTPNQLVGVEVEIASVSSTARNGFAWILLSPPGLPDPWNHAVYIAPEQPLRLEPGDSTMLTFAPPPAIQQGEYALSVWVHQIDPITTVRSHADGTLVDTTIVIAPPVFVTVDYVDTLIDTETGDQVVYVTSTLRNTTAETVTLAYSFTLAPPDDATPWATGALILPYQTITLEPGGAHIITTRSTAALNTGAYQVIAWINQPQADGSLSFVNNDVFATLIAIEDAS